MNTTQLQYEFLRTLRNPRSLIFTTGLPLVVFLVISGANRHGTLEGVSVPTYFMGAMAAYGAMLAAVQPGARIALDRSRGWLRQLRITPLRAGSYLLGKVLAAYLVVTIGLAVLFAAGVAVGVHATAAHWLTLAAMLLIGIAPLVALGIALGLVLAPDSLTAAVGGTVALLAMLGGAFGPVFTGGVMLHLVKLLPSYWLVQASELSDHHGWPLQAWTIIASWTALMMALAVAAYRRDTARS
jgi:ABC-2 type transport system permease protein